MLMLMRQINQLLTDVIVLAFHTVYVKLPRVIKDDIMHHSDWGIIVVDRLQNSGGTQLLWQLTVLSVNGYRDVNVYFY